MKSVENTERNLEHYQKMETMSTKISRFNAANNPVKKN